MKYELFVKLYDEVADATTLEYYIGERGWQDWMDEFGEGKADVIAAILDEIWTLHNCSMPELISRMGDSMADASRRYRIPLRTLENWSSEVREPAPYLKAFVAYAIFSAWMGGGLK